MISQSDDYIPTFRYEAAFKCKYIYICIKKSININVKTLAE